MQNSWRRRVGSLAVRIAFISRSSDYRPFAERLAVKLPAHEVVFRGTSRPLDLEGARGAGLDVFWSDFLCLFSGHCALLSGGAG